MNVHPFIEAEQAGRHNVKRACELLEVSRSAYYQRTSGVQSVRGRVDAQLTKKITHIHAVSRGTYGAPRIHADLADAGMRHGRKRVARLMRAAELAGKSPRRWRATTIPDPTAGRRPDLVGRDFTTDPAAVDSRWCGDITYINTWQGWLYLATVIDLASRRIVGWAVADHLKTDLIDAALTDALVRRRPKAGLVFHSDRGCQLRFKESLQHRLPGPILGVRPRLQRESSIRAFCGRLLRAAAMASRSFTECRDRSVPLGKYWRSSPLVFSFVPRCQGLCGSQK
ncbi:Integrase core domain protein [Micromonospora sp. MW-13]|nr:Integrase core domain protein [Micromonospora sp. MW-13]